MPENSVVRARIDERIKDVAAAVLAAMGLTVSDAFRIAMSADRTRTDGCRSSRVRSAGLAPFGAPRNEATHFNST